MKFIVKLATSCLAWPWICAVATRRDAHSADLGRRSMQTSELLTCTTAPTTRGHGYLIKKIWKLS